MDEDSTSSLRVYSFDRDDNVSRESVQPVIILIGQAYPNPFNQTTTIPLILPKSEKAMVTVYNLRGQNISWILDGQLSTGQHMISWNGLSENGIPVTAGTYLYAIQFGNTRICKPMVLIK